MKFIAILVSLAAFIPGCIMKELIPVYESSYVADNYPSGSTISYLASRFYIMGDDAPEILVLDDSMVEIERIPIFPKGDTGRLPKASKADIEASAVIDHQGTDSILFLGSGSLSPYRDSAFLLDPKTKAVDRIDMKGFYDQLRTQFPDLNIEAATAIDTRLLIGIRANRSHPDNYLVVTGRHGNSYEFRQKIKVQLPVDQAGISGLDYDKKRDILFITFSTEDTANAYDDGNIGESYLAILQHAGQILKEPNLTIPSLTKLTDLHPEFKNQKIESVSLKGNERRLLLVADDDQGNTKLFTLKF